jgi:hypothetical protein
MHKVLRRYPRFRLVAPIPVMWRQGARTTVDRARILSLRGLLLDTLHPLTPGETIEVVLMPPKMRLRATAVVRSIPHKAVAGLEFTKIDSATANSLKAFLAEALREKQARLA